MMGSNLSTIALAMKVRSRAYVLILSIVTGVTPTLTKALSASFTTSFKG